MWVDSYVHYSFAAADADLLIWKQSFPCVCTEIRGSRQNTQILLEVLYYGCLDSYGLEEEPFAVPCEHT
jgi:hypothetical protein